MDCQGLEVRAMEESFSYSIPYGSWDGRRALTVRELGWVDTCVED